MAVVVRRGADGGRIPDEAEDARATGSPIPKGVRGIEAAVAAFDSGRDLAAVIVTIMPVPRSPACAVPSGLPPEAGLHASIVPIALQAVFGTSRSLAVGPVAAVSLPTASAGGEVAATGTAGHAVAAPTLAGMSGRFLVALGPLRPGFVADLPNRPVIAGFLTASGIFIAASRLRHLPGIEAHGHTLIESLGSLLTHPSRTNWITLVLGATATAFPSWVRRGQKPALRRAAQTAPHLVTLRVYESLHLADARVLEDLARASVTDGCGITDVVLVVSAVNEADLSALESLEVIDARLTDRGVRLHLPEAKSPVTDGLPRSPVLDHNGGRGVPEPARRLSRPRRRPSRRRSRIGDGP